jgi:hypothetical protein
MAKRIDPKAKAKRQKIIAAGGAVILLGLLAFQVPRTMKMLNQKPPAPPPAAAPSTVPSDPSVLPTPGTVGGGAAPSASGGGTLVDSDISPTPSTGQLVAFGRFASKDPFQQQVEDDPAGGGGSSTSGLGDEGSTPTPGTTTPPPGVTPTSPGAPAGPTAPAAGPTAPAGAAVISINGAEETVQVGGEFPKESPVFRLVKLTRSEARIGIAGGALASGSPTVALKKDKTLTLVNTADGTRYELKLVSIG